MRRTSRFSFFRAAVDWFFGFDFFVSYGRKDGFVYPRELVRALETRGFRTFLDERGFLPGEELSSVTRRSIRRSSNLIFVARPEALKSGFVQDEIRTFAARGRLPIVIDVDHALDAQDVPDEIRSLVRERIYVPEFCGGIDRAPRPATVNEIARAFHGVRQDRLRFRVAMALVATFVGLFGAFLWQRSRAEKAAVSEQESVLGADIARSQRRQQEYVTDMRNAPSLWERGELTRLVAMLEKYAGSADRLLRGIEWNYWQRVTSTNPGAVAFAPTSDWTGLTFDETGQLLLATNQEGDAVCWDVSSRRKEWQVDGSASAAQFTRDGRYVVLVPELAASESSLLLFKRSDTTPSTPVGLHPFVSCVAISPDGLTFVTGDLAAHLYHRELPLGGFAPGVPDLTASYRSPLLGNSLDIQHGPVTALAYSQSGSYLGVGYEDGTAQVWDIRGAHVSARCSERHIGPITGLCFSEDEALIASQSLGAVVYQFEDFTFGDVKTWRRLTGEVQWKAQPHVRAFGSVDPTSGQVAIPRGQFVPVFSIDDKILYTTGDTGVVAWDVELGRQIELLKGASAPVIAVTRSPDGRCVAAASLDKTVRVWPAADASVMQELFRHDLGILTIAIDPARKLLAVLCEKPSSRTKGGRHVLEVTKDGDLFARVWDLDAKRIIADTPSFWSARPELRYDVNRRCFTLTVPDRSDEPELPGDLAGILMMLVDADSTVPSPGGTQSATLAEAGHIRIVADSGRTLHRELSASADGVSAIAWSADGRLLAAGGRDGLIHVWQVADGTELHNLQGHRREVSSLAFTSDGRRLISSSGLTSAVDRGPGEILVWDLITGQECLELGLREPCTYTSIAFEPESERLYVAANRMDRMSGITPSRVVMWDLSRGP